MKKKIEITITLLLIGLSSAIIYFKIAKIIDLQSPDISKLSLYTVLGFSLACICSYVFPKWNTVTLLKPSIVESKTELIKEYIRDSGSMFLYITFGYFGLLLWIYSSTNTFDIGWWSGIFFLFLYVQGLITPYLGLKTD